MNELYDGEMKHESGGSEGESRTEAAMDSTQMSGQSEAKTEQTQSYSENSSQTDAQSQSYGESSSQTDAQSQSYGESSGQTDAQSYGQNLSLIHI